MQLCDYELWADPSRDEILAHRELMRDINDLPIALAAIRARVDCFVSEDKDFTAHTPQTAQLHRELQIMLSGAFLREHMGWRSEALEQVRKRRWPEQPA